MSRKEEIKTLLEETFTPVYLAISDESGSHSGNRLESHFRLLIVSTLFSEKSKVERHRTIYRILNSHFKEGLHALAIETYTPEEWEEKEGPGKSPPCHSAQ